MNFNTTEELIQELRAGRMIVLADDEARENEGDLVVAASLTTPEHINFMTRHGRGLLCLAMTRERCQQLNLPLMDPTTDEAHRTNFTFTIDAHEGISTGVSAQDRAATIQAAVSADARRSPVVQPQSRCSTGRMCSLTISAVDRRMSLTSLSSAGTGLTFMAMGLPPFCELLCR